MRRAPRSRRPLEQLALYVATVAWLALPACSRVVPIGSGRPSPCGDTTCAAGEYCCNASCGICAPAGAGCIEIACGGPCDPQDVATDPACPSMRVLGFAWNGAACTLLPGCACVGADCGALYATMEECAADRAGCMMPPRPCISASDCGPGELCDFPDDGTCGSTGTTGTCRPSEPTCTGVYDPVCGCDGITHGNACEAAAAGVDLAFFGPCDPCAPEDARPAAGGTCDTVLGQLWNGLECVDLVGCACSGVDCPIVTSSDCAMRHAICIDPMRFDCAGVVSCARWAEVCVVDPSGAICEPRPPGCEVDACPCFPGVMCFEDGAGAATISR